MHRARTTTPPIAGWNDFADAIGPHLTADNPLASLAASGVQLAGEVGAALSDAAHLHRIRRRPMADLAGKRFESPDEVREFTDGVGRVELVDLMGTPLAAAPSSPGGAGRST